MADINATLTVASGITVDVAIGTTSPQAAVDSPVTVLAAATYDVLTADRWILVTYTATGSVAVTLTTAAATDGRAIIIKDAGGNASVNNITISTESTETIDGEDTAVISADYNSLTAVSDGTNWHIT